MRKILKFTFAFLILSIMAYSPRVFAGGSETSVSGG